MDFLLEDLFQFFGSVGKFRLQNSLFHVWERIDLAIVGVIFCGRHFLANMLY